MEWKLELVIVPVSDVDRAKQFYGETLGFDVDVDHHPNENFRVVQLTPPGSACSITIGIGLTAMEPGSLSGLHLVVTDIEAAQQFLERAGADVGELHHFDAGGQAPGVHPARGDYESFTSFKDPDGNAWVVQEVGYRPS